MSPITNNAYEFQNAYHILNHDEECYKDVRSVSTIY